MLEISYYSQNKRELSDLFSCIENSESQYTQITDEFINVFQKRTKHEVNRLKNNIPITSSGSQKLLNMFRQLFPSHKYDNEYYWRVWDMREYQDVLSTLPQIQPEMLVFIIEFFEFSEEFVEFLRCILVTYGGTFEDGYQGKQYTLENINDMLPDFDKYNEDVVKKLTTELNAGEDKLT